MLIYLIAGCAGIFMLIWCIKKLSHADEVAYRRIVKWGGVVFLLVIAAFLIRIGQPFVAAIVGGAGVFLPYVMRLLRLFGIARWIYSFFRKGKQQEKQRRRSNDSPVRPMKMTQAQAAEILGVKENASAKEIKTRYQKLMKQVHPDKGGSAHFASQLNEAKDVLLKK